MSGRMPVSLEGISPQGFADLKGTIYPEHGAFFPTTEHLFQLLTYSGQQLGQGPLQGLGLGIHTQAGICGWQERAWLKEAEPAPPIPVSLPRTCSWELLPS